MCGIAGIINSPGEPVEKRMLESMVNVMRHRGPDGEGYYTSGNAGLGHCRLSIIDLSEHGSQPMCNENGTLWIAFNGEIYNFAELRGELQKKGHRFKSNTDTEVILHLYEDEKENLLAKLRGMFAFALWDDKEKKLFCARDRFGIKPFYYANDKGSFIFASEIKAILKEPGIPRRVNKKLVLDFLAGQLCAHPDESFFENVYQLEPAHYMIVSAADGSIKKQRYWDIAVKEISDNGNVRETFFNALKESVRMHMVSDVPVGTCLSGGIDSSSLCGIITRLCEEGDDFANFSHKSFTAYYENFSENERPYAELMAKKAKLDAHFVSPDGKELFDVLPKVLYHQEEPFESFSIASQWHVMKAAAESGVKVLLDGQGADELLAGYPHTTGLFLAGLLKSGNILKWENEISCLARNDRKSAASLLLSSLKAPFFNRSKNTLKIALHPFLSEDFRRSFYHPPEIVSRHAGFLNDRLYYDTLYFSLPKLLRYEDKNSMAFSLEARVPYLDHKLAELCFSLPVTQKIHNGLRKFILRESMKSIVPDEILSRTDKVAFSVPAARWLKELHGDTVTDLTSSTSFIQRGYVDSVKFQKYRDDVLSGKNSDVDFLQRAVILELWHRSFAEADF